jgi:hypothetical protein
LALLVLQDAAITHQRATCGDRFDGGKGVTRFCAAWWCRSVVSKSKYFVVKPLIGSVGMDFFQRLVEGGEQLRVVAREGDAPRPDCRIDWGGPVNSIATRRPFKSGQAAPIGQH